MAPNPVMQYLWGVCDMAYPTGSREICFPAPQDTDEDYVALGSYQDLAKLQADGFVPSHPDRGYDLVGFLSLRKGNVNVIFTHEEEFYHNYVRATRLAKKLNLLKKEDRVALFQAVLYGRFPSD